MNLCMLAQTLGISTAKRHPRELQGLIERKLMLPRDVKLNVEVTDRGTDLTFTRHGLYFGGAYHLKQDEVMPAIREWIPQITELSHSLKA